MLSTLLLVASLAAAAAPVELAAPRPAAAAAPLELAPARPAAAAPRALRQEDGSDEPEPDDRDDDARHHRHLLLSGWGGEALAHGGSGRTSSFYGGEVAWAFSELDVGVNAAWYRSLRDATRAWTPVVMTRVTQRLLTRSGFEAAFSIGFGAGRPSHWIGWYQVALGARVPLGPVFAGAEVAFEQYDIIRLGGGVGIAF